MWRYSLVLLSLLLCMVVASCPRYRTLVMQGGGVKGTTYSGTVLALRDAGLLANITKFAGTSAGRSG